MSSPLGPLWVASPPEVHSALLSGGPGPASLLAAAGAWTALSAEYSSAAAELEGLLGAVAAGAWQGPTAEQYVAAHQPYVAWLLQASADAAATAAQLDTAAAAYSTALAAMPTLAELATNHLVHGVLVATNFFGINTIPIALNEADYLRMWLQAAATMALYQAAAGAALASVPRTSPAPAVVNPGSELAGNAASAAAATDPWQWLLQLLQQLYNAYTSFYSAMFQEILAFLQDPIGNTVKIIVAFLTNPEAAIVTYGPLLFALAYQVFFNLVGWPFWGMVLSSPFLLPVGLTLGLSAIALLPAAAPVVVPAAAAPLALAATTAHAVWPVAGMVPATGSVAGAPAGAGATGTSAGATAPAATGTTIAPYVVAVGGDWGPSLGPTVGGRSAAKAPAATIPAAGAAAVSSASARAKRRRRAQLHDHGDEFLDMDATGSGGYPEPSGVIGDGTQASERGAGKFGFAGTVPTETLLEAAGLTALAADDFGGGPRMPMVPGTWERGREEGGAGSQRDDLPSREF